MKKVIFIFLTILTKVSYASFPVVDKIEESIEPEFTSTQIILFVIAIIVNIFRIRHNIKTYGTWYKPWSSFPEWLRKYWWIFLLGFIGIIALGRSAMYMG